MSRTPLLAPVLAIALAASPLATAQDHTAPPSPGTPPPPAAISQRMGQLQTDMPLHRMPYLPRMHERFDWHHGPGMGAMSDLRALERLYRQTGRTGELAGLYEEVLAKSQDPMLRTYAYHHLAELQAQPAHPEQAIATLRKSLRENLANEARRRSEPDRMVHPQAPADGGAPRSGQR